MNTNKLPFMSRSFKEISKKKKSLITPLPAGRQGLEFDSTD
jgi:hypothetical protein